MTAQSPRPSSRSATAISRREPSGGISTSSMSNSTSTSNARGARVRRFPRSRASFRMLSSSLAHNEGLVWSMLDDKADHSPPLQTRGLNSDTCPRQTPAGSSPEPHPTATPLPSSITIPSSLTHPIDLTPFDSSQDLSSVPDPHYPVQPTSGHDTFLTHQDTFERATSVADFKIRLPTDEELQNPSVDLQDMSTLGFMLPPQYGSMDAYGSSAQVESSYLMDQQDRKSSVSGQPLLQSSGPGSYAPSYTASPQLLGSSPMIGTERRASGPRTDQLQSYAAQVPRSPYQSPHGSVRASPVPMAAYQTSSVDGPSIGTPPQAHAYPALQPAVGGHNMTALGYIPTYPAQYAPSSYDPSYAPLPHSMYHGASNASYPPPYIPSSMVEQQQSAVSAANGGNVRVINSRPKPQCWEHGCNGRQFSTFSNLLRHQREKSGTATKSSCPRCGAEFTRTTARNGHMAHDKCKPRRASESN